MTHRTWSHSVHHWHLPRPHLPRLPRLPRLRVSNGRAALVRKGATVVLCALLAGSLTIHLRGALRGPHAPAATAATVRA